LHKAAGAVLRALSTGQLPKRVAGALAHAGLVASVGAARAAWAAGRPLPRERLSLADGVALALLEGGLPALRQRSQVADPDEGVILAGVMAPFQALRALRDASEVDSDDIEPSARLAWQLLDHFVDDPAMQAPQGSVALTIVGPDTFAAGLGPVRARVEAADASLWLGAPVREPPVITDALREVLDVLALSGFPRPRSEAAS
ncbi:MAG TPA: hypothetical protein VFH51_04590, partial [Myxococcota bacterium]|nr:hypothetical protein [Myxococcota bacterium]